MIVYYLAASAWVKRYYQEIGTSWLQDLFAQNPTFACATLGVIEVTATLARKGKAGQLTSTALAQKIQELETDWQYFIQIQLTEAVVDQAKKFATHLALRGADSIHLAAAIQLKTLLDPDDQLILVSSDQELLVAGQRSGLSTLDPSEEETNPSAAS